MGASPSLIVALNGRELFVSIDLAVGDLGSLSPATCFYRGLCELVRNLFYLLWISIDLSSLVVNFLRLPSPAMVSPPPVDNYTTHFFQLHYRLSVCLCQFI